jgi:glycosyltransferase involved in cell wall biosynthesis
MHRISVIIPHYQDLTGLELCLAALERQTMRADQFEIVVADNNSPVGLQAVEAVVRKRAKVVTCLEKGAGPNRNAAVAASTGEILAFIDSDCQAHPDWLRAGVAGLSAFDFVGGQVTVLVDDAQRMTGAEAFESIFAFDFDTYINKKGFTGAGNMICPRSLFDAVGGFSKGVSEDVEWSRRAIAKGFRLGYVADAIVGHPARRTWATLKEKWLRVNIETFLLHRRSGKSRVAWIARCLALPASAIVHTPKALSAVTKVERLPDRLKAVATLYRIRFWRSLHCLELALAKDAPG